MPCFTRPFLESTMVNPSMVEMVTQTVWHRALRPVDVAAVESHPDFTVRVKLLLDAVITEIRALKQLDPCPDVVAHRYDRTTGEALPCRHRRHDAQTAIDDDEDEAGGCNRSRGQSRTRTRTPVSRMKLERLKKRTAFAVSGAV